MSKTAYLITKGRYSDYRVCAVFSTRQLAEAALPAYREQSDYEEVRVEAARLDPQFPTIPEGLHPFGVSRFKDRQGALWVEESALYELYPSEPFDDGDALRTGVLARNKDHAIKIAAERFAQYDAIQAGIA